MTLLVPATLALAAGLTDVEFRELYRTPKVMTGDTVTLLLVAALVFVLGALLAALGRARPAHTTTLLELDAAQWRTLQRAAEVLFALTVVGYTAWIASAVGNGLTPGRLREALLVPSAATSVEPLFVTVPGVTTLTQTGVAFVVVASLLLLHRRGRWIAPMLGLMLLLAVLRAYLLTERLALIELGIPLTVVFASHGVRAGRDAARIAVKLAPLVLIPLLIAVFGVLEYSRSWQYYSARTQQSYVEFTVTRLGGYYATAYNNAEIALRHQAEPGRVPYGTIAGLWEAPGVSQLELYERLNGGRGTPLLDENDDVLVLHGNPEYNSPGGLAVPVVDYGVAGGLAFLLGAGLLLGLVYRWFTERRPAAVLVYPVLATGLFELPRYLYWPQGRATPALAALLLIGALVHRAAGHPRTARRADVIAQSS